MLIIIDKITKKVLNNHGTNSAFPNGNIPNVALAENEEAIRIHDNSELAGKIMSANDYEFVFDENDTVIDINVIKTNAQARLDYEATTDFRRNQIMQQLKTLDAEIPRIIEDIIEQGHFNIHQSKTDTINLKKQLRLELQNIT